MFPDYDYEPELMPYFAFTVDDFCKDPYFIRWVTTPTDESDAFWQAFMREYPHKQADIQLAIGYIHTIHFQEMDPTPADLDRLKQRIFRDIAAPPPVRVIRWYQRPYLAVAAVLFLVVSVAMGWWLYQAKAPLTYETAYGKIETVRLADGSVVTLNANSLLTVTKHLTDGPVREVWLRGEAYFDVAKRNGARFIVHTPDATIVVLGTEFNVNTRREQTHIVLHEGKVQLTTNRQPAVVMHPGDMATVTPTEQRVRLQRVQPAQYEAWKESSLILDGKPLTEILNTLEDTFGVTIKLEDTELAKKSLTGKLRTEVADDCIENLALILDMRVEKDGTTYRFK